MTTPLQTAQKFYTAEEFMDLNLDPSYRYELVDGVIQKMSHPGGKHMLICAKLMTALILFLQGKNLGEVLPPGSFKLKIPGDIKDTVRSPDLTFVTVEQVKVLDTGAVTFPPALAIEVYSPNDRPGQLSDKLQDYQQAGWELVWVIYPLETTPRRKAGTIEIYHLQEESGLQPAQVLNQSDTLVGEGILDGFTMPVQELFV